MENSQRRIIILSAVLGACVVVLISTMIISGSQLASSKSQLASVNSNTIVKAAQITNQCKTDSECGTGKFCGAICSGYGEGALTTCDTNGCCTDYCYDFYCNIDGSKTCQSGKTCVSKNNLPGGCTTGLCSRTCNTSQEGGGQNSSYTGWCMTSTEKDTYTNCGCGCDPECNNCIKSTSGSYACTPKTGNPSCQDNHGEWGTCDNGSCQKDYCPNNVCDSCGY